MAFQFSEQHINEFHMTGATIFRGILPASLISDLRRVCDEGARIIREKKTGQAQRFQPVSKFDIDQKPFRDYAELPALHDALARVLSPRCTYANMDWLGVLIEPTGFPYCTDWHRDAREILNDEEWEWWGKQKDFGNQVNCALYEDSCTWFVPGSHLRDDTDGERALIQNLKPPLSAGDDASYEARERKCLEYCQAMPGAVRFYLDAGDFALYRPFGWHLGNYIPYKKRATLHDGVNAPEVMEKWMARMKEGKKPAPESNGSLNGTSQKIAV
jgi:hypothetical protein